MSDFQYFQFAEAVQSLHRASIRKPGTSSWKKYIDLCAYKRPGTREDQHKTLREMIHHMSVFDKDTIPKLFMELQIVKYSLDILRTKRGKDSAIETKSTFFLNRIFKLQNACAKFPKTNPVFIEIAGHMFETCEKVYVLYSSLYVQEYQQERCKACLDMYKEELIQKTCHPLRVQWWTDHEEYAEIFGSV